MEAANHEKRQQRRQQTAEDFTPSWLVNQMLDKLPKSTWVEGKTFCDPACGHGNMLVCVLQRKLASGHDPLHALQSVYGTDIMGDNVKECRLRLLKAISLQARVTKTMIEAVFSNIVQTPTTRFENGSLDYDFAFPPTTAEKTIDEWRKTIKEKLEKIDIEGLTESIRDGDTEKEDAEKEERGVWAREYEDMIKVECRSGHYPKNDMALPFDHEIHDGLFNPRGFSTVIVCCRTDDIKLVRNFFPNALTMDAPPSKNHGELPIIYPGRHPFDNFVPANTVIKAASWTWANESVQK